jgi:aminoglycoside 3-N-acetyltransferase
MYIIRKQDIIHALKALNIHSGDGLLVHSAIQYLGRPADGLRTYYEALLDVIEAGTLAVPTFNFAFARGEAYDPQSTPSQGMGAFSEFIRQRPEAQRTPHPLQSLAVIGKYADDLAGRDTPGAFDPGSAFERMLELGFKILLLGADVEAISMLHYSEQRMGVPYRYWKNFTAQYHTVEGWKLLTYRMYVRDLGIDPHLSLLSVQAELEARRLWHSITLNYGRISTCLIKDFVNVVDEFLKRDTWSLVSNR